MKNEMKSLGKKFSVLRYKYLTSLSNIASNAIWTGARPREKGRGFILFVTQK